MFSKWCKGIQRKVIIASDFYPMHQPAAASTFFTTYILWLRGAAVKKRKQYLSAHVTQRTFNGVYTLVSGGIWNHPRLPRGNPLTEKWVTSIYFRRQCNALLGQHGLTLQSPRHQVLNSPGKVSPNPKRRVCVCVCFFFFFTRQHICTLIVEALQGSKAAWKTVEFPLKWVLFLGNIWHLTFQRSIRCPVFRL